MPQRLPHEAEDCETIKEKLFYPKFWNAAARLALSRVS